MKALTFGISTVDDLKEYLKGQNRNGSVGVNRGLLMDLVKDRRVLVVVSGGVADYVSDLGVDVEVFDWDNYKAGPDWTNAVPYHFKDLAEPLDVPYEEEK